jgi:peptidoglycan/LPS O-acetylase OafA/YrhL
MGDDRSQERLTYAPALDGLRALSCLAVMLYHAGFLPGGFLGVDIFFTLSGFLITSLLLDEYRAEGKVDLRAFWRRRVFRIVPLFATVNLTWLAWGWAAHSPAGRETITGAVAGLMFATNWLLSTHRVTVGALGMGWSVAAEEQFYVLWPPVLLLLLRLGRAKRRMTAPGATAIVAVLLAAHRYVMAPHVPWARVWHGVETPADAVLVGCVVALGWRVTSRLLAEAAGVTLLGLMLLAHDGEPIVAQLVVPAVALCTALVIPTLQEQGAAWLAWRPLRAIGKRSYGLYLWSYPITYLVHDVHGVGGVGVPLLVIPATFAVTELTYRLIEVPFRRLGRSRLRSPAAATRTSPALRTAAQARIQVGPSAR